MRRRPTRSTRTVTLLPFTTLFRSGYLHLIDGSPSGRGQKPVKRWSTSIGLPMVSSFQVPRILLLWRSFMHRPVLIDFGDSACLNVWQRSEEHTSELQSLMRISYAVFCLKKKDIPPEFIVHTV